MGLDSPLCFVLKRGCHLRQATKGKQMRFTPHIATMKNHNAAKHDDRVLYDVEFRRGYDRQDENGKVIERSVLIATVSVLAHSIGAAKTPVVSAFGREFGGVYYLISAR